MQISDDLRKGKSIKDVLIQGQEKQKRGI